MNTKYFVAFISKKTESSFEDLKNKQSQEKELYQTIEKIISELKKDPLKGIRIPKKLWPKEYVQKYEITNLWKINLPNSWRLIYTIQSDEVMIISIILDWFNHKKYERKFKY